MEAPGARGVSGTGVGAEGVGGEPVDGDEVHANRAQEVVLVGREALRRGMRSWMYIFVCCSTH